MIIVPWLLVIGVFIDINSWCLMFPLLQIITLFGIVSVLVTFEALNVWKILLLLSWNRVWSSTFVFYVMKLSSLTFSFLGIRCKGLIFFMLSFFININGWGLVSSLLWITTLYNIVNELLTSKALDMSEILLLHLFWNLLINSLNGNLRLGNPVKSMFNLHVDLLDCNQKTASRTLAGARSNLKCGYLQRWFHREMHLTKAS